MGRGRKPRIGPPPGAILAVVSRLQLGRGRKPRIGQLRDQFRPEPATIASIGPRSETADRQLPQRDSPLGVSRLQLGRGRKPRIGSEAVAGVGPARVASIGPRSETADRSERIHRRLCGKDASIGPRSETADRLCALPVDRGLWTLLQLGRGRKPRIGRFAAPAHKEAPVLQLGRGRKPRIGFSRGGLVYVATLRASIGPRSETADRLTPVVVTVKVSGSLQLGRGRKPRIGGRTYTAKPGRHGRFNWAAV